MKKKENGQIFTLDLFLALIPLTIAIGISSNVISGVVHDATSYISEYSTERKINDFIDALVKSAGIPENWNSTNHPTVVGLAKYNMYGYNRTYTNYLDLLKIESLNDSYISNAINTENFNMTLSFMEINASTVTWGSPVPSQVRELHKVERVVYVDLGRFGTVMSIEDLRRTPGGGPDRYYTETELTEAEKNYGSFWLYLCLRNLPPGSTPNMVVIINNCYLVDHQDLPAKKYQSDPNPTTTFNGYTLYHLEFEDGDPGTSATCYYVWRIYVPPQCVGESMNVTIWGTPGEVGDAYVIRAPSVLPWYMIDPNLSIPGMCTAKLTLEVWK